MDNHMKLQFEAISDNELIARNAVAFFILPLNPDISELSDVKTAVSEAVTNSIVHGYKSRGGVVTLECSIQDNVIHIVISDDGCGIPDVEKAVQPFFTTSEEDERSGMGFTIMQSFMSVLNVESTLNVGTTVRMSKVLGAGKREDA